MWKLACIQVIGLVVGVGAGTLLGGPTSSDTGDGSPDKGKGKTGEISSVSESSEPLVTGRIIKFTRPFVIPLPEKTPVNWVSVISVNIEVDEAFADEIPSLQERMRDAITSRLIGFAHSGGLDGSPGDPATHDALRAEISAAVSERFHEDPYQVMIVSMLKRPV